MPSLNYGITTSARYTSNILTNQVNISISFSAVEILFVNVVISTYLPASLLNNVFKVLPPALSFDKLAWSSFFFFVTFYFTSFILSLPLIASYKDSMSSHSPLTQLKNSMKGFLNSLGSAWPFSKSSWSLMSPRTNLLALESAYVVIVYSSYLTKSLIKSPKDWLCLYLIGPHIHAYFLILDSVGAIHLQNAIYSLMISLAALTVVSLGNSSMWRIFL